MNKFTTGLLLGGVAVMVGVGYLMQDKQSLQKIAKKGGYRTWQK